MAAGQDADVASSRYELLREAVLSGAVGRVRTGLALLRRAGVAAFVAFRPGPETAPVRSPGAGSRSGSNTVALVNALAAMVLSRSNVQSRAPG